MSTEYTRTQTDQELRKAIMLNDLSRVENLLTQQSQSININDVTKNGTPLIIACMNNSDHRIVLTLLRHGADPNISTIPFVGWTILHNACYQRNSHLIELLLKFNANVNCRDEKYGRIPLQILLDSIDDKSNGNEEYLRLVKLLLDHHENDNNTLDTTGISCLFTVIENVRRGYKRLDALRLLLNSKIVDVNAPLKRCNGVYNEGDTILHAAVRINNIEMVNMILECCCNTPKLLLILNYNDETAYDIAKHRLWRSEPIMECLKITLLLQCNVFLRQKWIQQQPIQNEITETNGCDDYYNDCIGDYDPYR